MENFADVLRPIRSLFPETLLDGQGWERLIARAEKLSPFAADAAFGFEFRLDGREASGDLLLLVPPRGRFADALVRDGSSDGSEGMPLARFFSELKQEDSPFAAAVDVVALEYDIVDAGESPVPGVFLRSAADSGYADPDVLAAVIALVAGWDREPPERSGIARVMAALPTTASIRWAGVFPGRKRRAVRLLVRALEEDIAAFLTEIGCPHDAAALHETLSDFHASGVDNHVLALDVVREGVLPGFGFELSRPKQFGSWQVTLDMMVHKGLCLPKKAAAFGSLAARHERIFSHSGVFEAVFGIHHIKFAFPAAGQMNGLAFDTDTPAVKGYIICDLHPSGD